MPPVACLSGSTTLFGKTICSSTILATANVLSAKSNPYRTGDPCGRERVSPQFTPLNSPSIRALNFAPIANIGAAGLLMPSIIKPMMFTMESKLVCNSLGRLADNDQRALRHCIALLIG